MDVLRDSPETVFDATITEAEALRRRLIRLALDVHDGPMQNLTAAGYIVNELRRRLAGTTSIDGASLSADLDRLLTQLAGTERDLRGLIGRLEHADVEIDPLDEILGAELDRFERRCPIPVEIDLRGGLELDSRSQALAVRAVLREALTNVAKHARARRVRIRVEQGRAGILLQIEDDGAGFDPGHVRAGSLGIAGMTQRVDLLGGELDVRSAAGGPTVVTARFQRWNGGRAALRPV
jgi:signal transduction histidine kinase